MGEVDVNFGKFLKSYYGWRWRKFPFFEFYFTAFAFWIFSNEFEPKMVECMGFKFPVGELNLWELEQLRGAFPKTSAIFFMFFFLLTVYYVFLYRLTLPLLLLSQRKVVCVCRRRALGGLVGVTTFGQIIKRDDQVYFLEYGESLKWYNVLVLFKYLSFERLLPPEVAEGIKNNSPENHEFDFVLNGKKCHFKVFNIE